MFSSQVGKRSGKRAHIHQTRGQEFSPYLDNTLAELRPWNGRLEANVQLILQLQRQRRVEHTRYRALKEYRQ